MKTQRSRSNVLPPRLSMDEYADFVGDSLREADPVCIARQKQIEERIRMAFRITGRQARSLMGQDGEEDERLRRQGKEDETLRR